MFGNAINAVSMWIRGIAKPEELVVADRPTMEEMVAQARAQWLAARAYFENVSEPELVDFAINNLEAAEKRYNYLLKKVREQ